MRNMATFKKYETGHAHGVVIDVGGYWAVPFIVGKWKDGFHSGYQCHRSQL